MPGAHGRIETPAAPVRVDDPPMIHRLVVNGTGHGCVDGHRRAPETEAAPPIRLSSDRTPPSVDVAPVFPGSREGPTVVRIFVAWMQARLANAERPDAPVPCHPVDPCAPGS